MSWTRFKERHLLSINMTVVAAIILYQVRKDFHYHWVLLLWPVLTALIPALDKLQLRFLRSVGHVNSTILLTIFYFSVLTPFAFIYRRFYLNPAFKSKSSGFVKKESVSDFDRPF